MRTIAILNLKGGVGKTVTAINLAAILAADHKQRVLLIDADSQQNSTEFFGADPKCGSLADVLRPGYDETGIAGLIQETGIRRLDILPASDALMDCDLTAIRASTADPYGLQRAVIHLDCVDLYDYVVIDCPPAFNAATTAALLAADDVIIPMKVDAFAVRGFSNLMRQIDNMRTISPRLRVAGVLLTMVYSNAKAMPVYCSFREGSLPVFERYIRRSPKVDGMTYAQEPITQYSPRSAAGRDYRAFVDEYLKGVADRV